MHFVRQSVLHFCAHGAHVQVTGIHYCTVKYDFVPAMYVNTLFKLCTVAISIDFLFQLKQTVLKEKFVLWVVPTILKAV